MDLIEKALEFEKTSLKSISINDRIQLSRQAKALILELNTIYKEKKDEYIMDIMKRLTVKKHTIEKKLTFKALIS